MWLFYIIKCYYRKGQTCSVNTLPLNIIFCMAEGTPKWKQEYKAESSQKSNWLWTEKENSSRIW